MIRLKDPTGIGPALAEVRGMLGMSRRQCARLIAAAADRSETSVNAQLWTWDTGRTIPDTQTLVTYLDVLGLDMLLDFKIENEET